MTGVTLVNSAEYHTLAASAIDSFYLFCPAGKATGGGFTSVDATTEVRAATPYKDYYYLQLQNTVATADGFNMYVTCLTTQGVAVSSRLTPAAKAARPRK